MKLRGFFALLAGIGLFSTIEVCAKLMRSGGSIAGDYPFWLASIRFIIAGLVLLIPALLKLREKTFSVRDGFILTGLALLGVTLLSSLYHLSLTFLPANVAALVFSCNPVFVVLFSPLILPEKITGRKLSAVALCLAGICILAHDRADGLSATGLLLMLLSSVVFAIYTVFFKKLTPRYGALPITAFTGLIGGLCIVPLGFAFEGFPVASYGLADWTGILYLALAGTALAYFLFIYGMGHVEAGIGSMSFFLKPFLAALFSWALLDEVLTGPMLVGGAFILGGMTVALIPTRRKIKS